MKYILIILMLYIQTGYSQNVPDKEKRALKHKRFTQAFGNNATKYDSIWFYSQIEESYAIKGIHDTTHWILSTPLVINKDNHDEKNYTGSNNTELAYFNSSDTVVHRGNKGSTWIEGNASIKGVLPIRNTSYNYAPSKLYYYNWAYWVNGESAWGEGNFPLSTYPTTEYINSFLPKMKVKKSDITIEIQEVTEEELSQIYKRRGIDRLPALIRAHIN